MNTARPHPLTAVTSFPTPPGSMYLTRIDGWVGRGVSAAQAFTRGGALYTHCGIYKGDGQIIQSEYGGARIRDFNTIYGGREVLWSDAPIQRHLTTEQYTDPGAEQRLRDAVVESALAMVGSPYGFSTYFTVAGSEWRVPGWQRLHDWSMEHGRQICSTLVTQAYRLAGIPLFPNQAVVTPGDLFRLDEAWVRTRLSNLESRVTAIEDKIA